MYKISVPVPFRLITDENREIYFKQLKTLKAERVFMFIPYLTMDKNIRKQWLDKFKTEVEKFHEKGYEVGLWMWAFERNPATDFTLNVFFDGKTDDMRPCILDEDFLADTCKWLQCVAKCGADYILFDDDTHINEAWYRGLACICPLHLKKYSEYLGREVTAEEIVNGVLCGGPNELRDAWLNTNREALKNFALRVRTAVDEVNPEVRIGQCSVMSMWDLDGMDSYEYSRLLAGNTKPYMRLIGAPYWAPKKQFGLRLADIISLIRMEASWRENKDIEIMCEGDTFPRPRYNVPAAYIELYDMAIRFAGETDGILRYSIEYQSGPLYETGYLEHFEANKEIYDALDSGILSGGKMTGVRIFEAKDKISTIKLPEEYIGNKYIEELFYSPASRFINNCSLSSVYDGKGHGGVCFGHNAKILTEEDFKMGLILDIPAALELKEKGIDVGLKSAEYIGYKEYENFHDSHGAVITSNWEAEGYEYDIKISENAEMLSEFCDEMCNPSTVASYRYENADGNRFIVFAMDAYRQGERFFRNYSRQKQITDNIEWLSGDPADAVCLGNPDLTIYTKKDGEKLIISLYNTSVDSVLSPIVTLSKEYKTAEFINCKGELKGNKLRLSKLGAFEFAGIKLYK